MLEVPENGMWRPERLGVKHAKSWPIFFYIVSLHSSYTIRGIVAQHQRGPFSFMEIDVGHWRSTQTILKPPPSNQEQSFNLQPLWATTCIQQVAHL